MFNRFRTPKQYREDPLLKAALAFVNDIRKLQGRSKLRSLPKGIPGRAMSCPIAKAIDGEVSHLSAIYLSKNGSTEWCAIPADAENFIVDFDQGKYPELVDRRNI